MVQLLVCTSRCRGGLREAMPARDVLGCTLLKSARAYALMPHNKVETEGAWFWRWDVAAGRAGAN